MGVFKMKLDWGYLALIVFFITMFGGMAFDSWVKSNTDQARYNAYSTCVKSNQENCKFILGK